MQLELFTRCERCYHKSLAKRQLCWVHPNGYCEGCFIKESIKFIKHIQFVLKQKHRDRIRGRIRDKKKMIDDPSFRARKNARNRIGKILKRLLQSDHPNRKASKSRLIGCSRIELKHHLERQFTNGMSWDNYGKWHIDHIKPLATFNLRDLEELKKASHYSNLQPLWAEDNLSKGDKYVGII